jgi:hypothetical protein
MDSYYVAAQLDGSDFRAPSRNYAAALVNGTPLCEAVAAPVGTWNAERVLHVSATPDNAIRGERWRWPCRLFEIGAEDRGGGRYDVAGSVCVQVLAEHPAHLVFGPYGQRVASHIVTAVTTVYTTDQVDLIYEWGRNRPNADEALRPLMSTRFGVGPAAEAAIEYLRRHLAYSGPYVSLVAVRALLAIAAGDRLPPAVSEQLTHPWVDIVGPLP